MFFFALLQCISAFSQKDTKFQYESRIMYFDSVQEMYFYYGGFNQYAYSYFGKYKYLNDSTVLLTPKVKEFLHFIQINGTRTEYPVFCYLNGKYKINKNITGNSISLIERYKDTILFQKSEKIFLDSLLQFQPKRMTYELVQVGRVYRSTLEGVCVKITRNGKYTSITVFTGNLIYKYENIRRVKLKLNDFVGENQKIGVRTKKSNSKVMVFSFGPYYDIAKIISLDGTPLIYKSFR